MEADRQADTTRNGKNRDQQRKLVRDLLEKNGPRLTPFQRHVVMWVVYAGFLELNQLARRVYGIAWENHPESRGGWVAACKRAIQKVNFIATYRTTSGQTVAYVYSDDYTFHELIEEAEADGQE